MENQEEESKAFSGSSPSDPTTELTPLSSKALRKKRRRRFLGDGLLDATSGKVRPVHSPPHLEATSAQQANTDSSARATNGAASTGFQLQAQGENTEGIVAAAEQGRPLPESKTAPSAPIQSSRSTNGGRSPLSTDTTMPFSEQATQSPQHLREADSHPTSRKVSLLDTHIKPGSAALKATEGDTSPKEMLTDVFAENQDRAFGNESTVLLSRKTTVRFGGTMVREISLATFSMIERNASKLTTCTSTALVFAVLTAGVLLLVMRHDQKRPLLGSCTVPACDRAREDLQQLLDLTVHPCHDLYRHVCHKWRETADAGLDFLDQATRRMLLRVNDSLLHYSSEADNTVPHDVALLAQFYNTCWRFVYQYRGDAREMLELEELREYAALAEMSNFADVLERLIRISLAHGIDTVLCLCLVRSASGANYLRLRPGQTLAQKLGEPALSGVILGYLKELLARSTFAGRFNENAITDQEQHMQSFLASPMRKESFKIAVLGSLSRQFGTNRWISTLNSILPESERISTLSTINVNGLDSIRGAVAFFEKLTDYGVLYFYLQILVDAFRFDYMRTSGPLKSNDVIKSCLKATQDVVRHAPFTVGTRVLGWTPGREGDVSADILRAVVATATAHKSTQWMGENKKRWVSSLLAGARVKSQATVVPGGLALRAEDLSRASAMSTFPTLYLRLRSREREALLANPPQELENLYTSHFLESRIFYDYETNSVVLPASGRLEPVLYSTDVPYEFSMATLGALMSKELMRVVFSGDTPGGQLGNDETTRISRFQDCLFARASAVFNVSLKELHNDSADLFVWVYAARLAHGALRSVLEPLSGAPNWNEYWTSAQMTFFRRFCLLSCTSKSERHLLAARIRCVLPLANLQQFENVFSCPDDSPLRTASVCTL